MLCTFFISFLNSSIASFALSKFSERPSIMMVIPSHFLFPLEMATKNISSI